MQMIFLLEEMSGLGLWCKIEKKEHNEWIVWKLQRDGNCTLKEFVIQWFWETLFLLSKTKLETQMI